MINDLWTKLKNTEKPIVLYGMGNGADKIYNELKNRGISISGIFATAEFVRKKTVYGFELSSYDEIKKKFPNMVVLVCFGSSRQEVFNEVKRISSQQELYFPDVPVYGDLIFDGLFFEKNRDRLEQVYARLKDEKSKETFKNTVMFKLTGQCKYLYDCQVSPDEPYNSFFKLSEDETYLDLGAYNGDTVIDFKNRVRSYSKIIAVEPNSRSFRKLKENTADIDNIVCYNLYIGDKKGKIQISKGRGRGTTIAAGGVTVRANSVDNIVANEKITLLKADVEGEEINMLSGAKEVIAKNMPKMQIACYHRSDDLWTIPQKVLSISENYDIYMRHFPYLPAWDTNYYFVPSRA